MLVTVEAVQAQLGEEFAEPVRAQVEVFIARACSEMLRAVPTINAHLTAAALDPVLVRGVGVDVVTRAIENMRIGWRVTEETYPDVTTRFAAAPEEFIYLTAAETSKLHPTSTNGPLAGSAGAYIVSLSG
ncbi:hypothetical protein CH274_15410 [Rhodococcus sp. 06-418-5]|nr:hypothetical protein CH274_15410 [Rhodococcus sp. 06-418-5]OZE13375.1 hypothetical protein CH250_05530 [Rhodococcus sp. 05-2255-3C]OZE16012.1 hypothetical protein CH249_01835 [Rhodococcus sp. 05-2255-3B1]OZE19052.1 hypothetical protein CH255_13860 [Rhodococcus sp. 05-2255-2A2]